MIGAGGGVGTCVFGRFFALGVEGVMVVLVAVVVEERGRDCIRETGLTPGEGSDERVF